MYLLAIILLVLNSLNIRHQESLQQDRFQTYLLDVNAFKVNAFKLEIDGIDEQIQHEMVVVDDLNHRVEFIQSQRILHRKKV